MNKFFYFLAASSLVFLSACSDDKEETRADICKSPTEKCLVGKWRMTEPSIGGTLCLDKDLNYRISVNNGYEYMGTWKVNGSAIEVNCLYGDCPGCESDGKGTVKVAGADGNSIEIIKSDSKCAIMSRVSNESPGATSISEKFSFSEKVKSCY